MAARTLGRLLYSKIQTNMLNPNPLAVSVRLMSATPATQGRYNNCIYLL